MVKNSLVVLRPSLVEVHTKTGAPGGGGGKRGKIAGFSASARLRMLEFMHSITFSRGLLVTLTYGDDYPRDCGVYHAHLKAWRRWFEKKYGSARMVWKLEFQKRGAPHFHIFVLDLWSVNIPECSKKWHAITGSAQEIHEKIGFDVKRVSTASGVRNVGAYVTKYISKEGVPVGESEIEQTGRFWGHWNIEKEPVRIFSVDPARVEALLKNVCAKQGIKTDYIERVGPLNITLFTGRAGKSDGCEAVKSAIIELQKSDPLSVVEIEH